MRGVKRPTTGHRRAGEKRSGLPAWLPGIPVQPASFFVAFFSTAVVSLYLLLPDGRTFSLEQFQGLNQIGETGLKDRVDRHYLQVFGASLAVGALSGLAQFSTRSSGDQSFSDLYRQGAGAGLAQSSARILERFLNQLPTITIREGHRIKVSLTSDLTLPAWFDGRDRRPFVSSGGLR